MNNVLFEHVYIYCIITLSCYHIILIAILLYKNQMDMVENVNNYYKWHFWHSYSPDVATAVPIL